MPAEARLWRILYPEQIADSAESVDAALAEFAEFA